MTSPFEIGLDKNPANFVALTPLSFIERSAATYPDRTAVIHGAIRRSWAETYTRCRQLASALEKHGLKRGDTVAAMLPNIPAMVEAHFGVSMMGGVLNALNIRLDADAIAFILDHGEAKVLLTDREFSATIKAALDQVGSDIFVIDVDDATYDGGEFLGTVEYEDFIAGGDPEYPWTWPADEWEACSLNYTSGTTGNPKGVVYHHRGAFLNAIGNMMVWAMPPHPVYLWTLPMFHCNGWCFPWTVAALAGTNVCLRRVTGANIYDAIATHKVTHMCGAPIVMSFLVNATQAERKEFSHKVKFMAAAAPPPAATLEAMQREGIEVTHAYGLTETYGPAVMCAWHPEWDALPIEEQAQKKSRQGVPYHALNDLQIIDPDTMQPVPADGETMGEAMFQGNIVMKGYLKNPETSEKSLAGGWFHSGDLGVMHPDGYIQLKDRSKDIIISGGENISSIEVEGVLYKHPAVLTAAVVAKPDDKWGETPCAFVELKAGVPAPTAEDIIQFCRDNLAHYKCPKHVVFGELPKTSTGKIQKFKLRDAAAEA